MKSLVHIIAVVYSILFCIGVIVLIVYSTQVGLPIFCISIVVGVAQLILIWALYAVIDRLEVLENILLRKGVVEENDIVEEYGITDIEPDPNIDTSNIRLCKKCGYQLFPEDTTCPLCGEKADNDKAE